MSGASCCEAVAVDVDQARPLEEVVGAEARSPPRRAAGGQDVRRAGGVVADGDRRVVAEEDRAGVGQPLGQAVGVGGRDVQVLGGDQVRERDRLVLVADQDQGAEPFEAVAGQVAAAERGELLRQGLGDAVDQVGLPGDQDAGARRVLGLADQVGGDVARVGRPVGDQDDLARPGDAVDVDLAVDLPLGQRDEQVARPDDLVDRRDPLDPVGQGRHGLGAADPVDLGDAQRVAGGQEVGVVAAERRRRHDHGDLLDPRRLRRDDRHQERRRIRRRPARDADADPPERPIAQPQLAARPAPHGGVAVEDARLERQDVVADPAERPEVGRRRPP